jgi:hypothetical protein
MFSDQEGGGVAGGRKVRLYILFITGIFIDVSI